MPKQNYKEYPSADLYTTMYEQYYFKNNPSPKIRPIKRKKPKKKESVFNKIIYALFLSVLMFCIFPVSYKTFIADIFPQNTQKALNIDYEKLMFPTNNYLYKDLFLGKYIIKDTQYNSNLMVDIKESSERTVLKNRLLELAKQYNRIDPAVYVYEYGNKSYVDISANKAYPAASIIKLPILVEMFRKIEMDKFTLNDTMILKDYYRASGSGKLQYSQGGVAHSMDYLARIMIENSDNSSTNMIMAKIGGMPEINKAIHKWGLKTTHVNNWLPDLEGTNITTARELGKILYNIDTTNILTTESKQKIADYLSHVRNNRLIQAGLPSDAILLHKTGDIGYMLGDAGIVKTASGKKYIVVILARRPYNSLKGKEFIVKASNIIYNNIN